ncbi:putative ABC-type amino acid transport/signal transduction system, periplasmic component/domain [Candidatus Terasakiella magnetica]|uniref:Putative ABC-type amino acid transport/signal transduction system, periplasmic component/domain n=1 Tax=Candidatus Terasakiella magnetica TaxID=1867952 RepID=A0A1C3RDB0_9PROT|nr:transporter substrate-binding domain-containing protein [Candidatus Terasakiella magnetica]SCA55266.1 putative ABC-type amino acid transport/signal transduction system, periplasmic component/domain [Candidatus Terasakiella magnetica]
MPYLSAFIIFIMCCIWQTTSAIAANEKPDVLFFGYEDIENPPYYLGTGQTIPQDNPGLTIELLQQTAKRLNTPVHFKRMPWKRGLLNLQNNRLNGLFDASYKKERAAFSHYPLSIKGLPDPTRALMVQRYMLYIKKGQQLFDWDGKSLRFKSSLKTIGIKTGYSIGSDLKKLGALVEEASNSEKNITKLIVERLTSYADLEGMVDQYLAQTPHHRQQVEKIEPPIKTKPYYLIFSQEFYRQYPDFAESFWDEIARFKLSPAYAALEEKYQNAGSN